MSLILRKNCQEHLNSIGLTSFHVGINDNKKLVIYTTCGKPFITVWGISFNRVSPTKDEIEYASELFNNFLIRHQQEIEDYINAYDNFYGLPIVKQITDLFSIRNYTYDRHIRFTSGNFNIKATVPKDGNEAAEFYIDSLIEHDKNSICASAINTTDCNAALTYLAKYTAYIIEKDKLEALQTRLATCDV